MVRTIVLVLTLALSSTLFLGPLKSYASPFELSYDDGDFDYAWSDFYPGGAAVRFSPPSSSWRIKSVRVHGVCSVKGSAYFYVQIWDSGLNTKYSAAFSFKTAFKDGVLDWYTIDLPNVVVTGDFYIVIIPMFTLDGSQLWISVDNDPPFSNNSFIVNVDTHTFSASINATSKKPGDFMIRVVGEPTQIPPELRLSSVSVGVDETIVAFTYGGEIVNMGARLTRLDGSFTEENVSRIGQSLIVRVRDDGVLNVFVVTPGGDLVGSSVRLETGLRILYRLLLDDYEAAISVLNETGRQVEFLWEENERLKVQAREINQSISVLDRQIFELMVNITRQNQQVAELSENIRRSRLENMVLFILLIVIMAFLIYLAFSKRLKHGK
ncbi:MAG: hypothetical protein QXZ66_10490 [Thermoproteota archaeon]